jgi:hypothetical protein
MQNLHNLPAPWQANEGPTSRLNAEGLYD